MLFCIIDKKAKLALLIIIQPVNRLCKFAHIGHLRNIQFVQICTTKQLRVKQNISHSMHCSNFKIKTIIKLILIK